MTNKSNSKEKIITIKTGFSIPLKKLAKIIFKYKENDYCLPNLLYSNPKAVNVEVRKIIKEIICNRKLSIKVKEIKFSYYDKMNIGVSHFDVKLEGTISELKKITRKNKLFFFDWKGNKERINSTKAYYN